MIRLSLLQARVYFILRQNGSLNVTQIASHMDDTYPRTTSTVSRPLKALLSYGLISREAKNARVVQYRVTGHPPPFMIQGEEHNPIGDFELQVIWKNKLKAGNENIRRKGRVDGVL